MHVFGRFLQIFRTHGLSLGGSGLKVTVPETVNPSSLLDRQPFSPTTAPAAIRQVSHAGHAARYWLTEDGVHALLPELEAFHTRFFPRSETLAWSGSAIRVGRCRPDDEVGRPSGPDRRRARRSRGRWLSCDAVPTPPPMAGGGSGRAAQGPGASGYATEDGRQTTRGRVIRGGMAGPAVPRHHDRHPRGRGRLPDQLIDYAQPSRAPGRERFGLSVGPDGRHILWLDNQESRPPLGDGPDSLNALIASINSELWATP